MVPSYTRCHFCFTGGIFWLEFVSTTTTSSGIDGSRGEVLKYLIILRTQDLSPNKSVVLQTLITIGVKQKSAKLIIHSN